MTSAITSERLRLLHRALSALVEDPPPRSAGPVIGWGITAALRVAQGATLTALDLTVEAEGRLGGPGGV